VHLSTCLALMVVEKKPSNGGDRERERERKEGEGALNLYIDRSSWRKKSTWIHNRNTSLVCLFFCMNCEGGRNGKRKNGEQLVIIVAITATAIAVVIRIAWPTMIVIVGRAEATWAIVPFASLLLVAILLLDVVPMCILGGAIKGTIAGTCTRLVVLDQLLCTLVELTGREFFAKATSMALGAEWRLSMTGGDFGREVGLCLDELFILAVRIVWVISLFIVVCCECVLWGQTHKVHGIRVEVRASRVQKQRACAIDPHGNRCAMTCEKFAQTLGDAGRVGICKR
jgi:hypothetical protein